MIHQPMPNNKENLSPGDLFLDRLTVHDNVHAYLARMDVPPKIILESALLGEPPPQTVGEPRKQDANDPGLHAKPWKWLVMVRPLKKPVSSNPPINSIT